MRSVKLVTRFGVVTAAAGAALLALVTACGSSVSGADVFAPPPADDGGVAEGDASPTPTTDAAGTVDAAGDDAASSDGGGDDGGSLSLGIQTSTLSATDVGACDVRANGALVCWGGMQTATTVVSGTSFSGVVGRATKSSGQPLATCALRADGALYCGNPFSLAVTDFGPFAAVGAGNAHTCVITKGGVLECWGTNDRGQLGLGDELTRAAPTPVGASSSWVAVAGGAAHPCALDATGALFCWGDDSEGQLGDGGAGASDAGPPHRTTPARVGGSTRYRFVTANGNQTCAVAADRSLYCWGGGTKVPTLVGGDASKDWSRVAIGMAHSCAVKTTGTLHCWGFSAFGALGPTPPSLIVASPAPMGADSDWSEVAVGRSFACAKKTSGAVQCWGKNDAGQLGSGSSVAAFPAHKIGAGADWLDVSAGNAATCAVKKTGELDCWGLAPGATLLLVQQVPTKVGTATDWARVAVGAHACAMHADDALDCWGPNGDGQIGDGTSGNTVATPTSTGLKASQAAIGARHTCAIEAGSGHLFCWGDGSNGKLFLAGNTKTPRQVGTETWTRVASGNQSSCALKSDGTVWCAGSAYTGTQQVGLGAKTGFAWVAAAIDSDTYYGVQSGKLVTWSTATDAAADGAETTWTQASASKFERCAVRAAGSLACAAIFSSLGTVGVATDWQKVSHGGLHTCGLRNGGELYCGGSNEYGQVGDGTAFSATPLLVP
ncbi:MAG: hypothetical protein U0235_27425 [Polyangiaceae bacterium]